MTYVALSLLLLIGGFLAIVPFRLIANSGNVGIREKWAWIGGGILFTALATMLIIGVGVGSNLLEASMVSIIAMYVSPWLVYWLFYSLRIYSSTENK
jgi:hypothetical protein